MTELRIPEMSLVLLVGVSGSGKSTFAARHFAPTEVLSSDVFRGLVSDDPDSQDATGDAFDALHHLAGIRLRRGRLTVVDATNTQRAARASLLALAREHDVLPVAIVLNPPEKLAAARSRYGPKVVGRQYGELARSLRKLRAEGFRSVHLLGSAEEIDSAVVERTPSYNDRRDLHGPFDLIGDVHGCLTELTALLEKLGWQLVGPDGSPTSARHPAGRTAVFLGDLVDRGPDTPGVLRLAMGMVADGVAFAIMGNHEQKLVRALRGRDVQRSHGVVESLEQLAARPEEFVAAATEFMDGLRAHYVLDDGNLVVAHAGLRERFHGRASKRVRAFALYGETTGETDEFGLPVRYPWATEYRGAALVAYGHTPVPETEWVNNTICLDTGCVFGGSLTALRYPERETVAVAAQKTWFEPIRPLTAPTASAEERPADQLDVSDVLGKRGVTTGEHGRITIPAENSAAALEVLSRYAVHPRWLVYLPPTMAPVGELPEHPTQAFDAFAGMGVARVVMQAKHMGSRAVVLVCRSEDAAAARFGATSGETGIVLSRTGRRLLDDPSQLLTALRGACETTGLWDSLGTDWLALDCELLPWTAAGTGLVGDRYEPMAAAALADTSAVAAVLSAAVSRGVDLTEELAAARDRSLDAVGFDTAWRRYAGLGEPARLAPFCVLAGAGEVCAGRPVSWQLDILDRLVAAAPEHLVRTERFTVDVDDPASRSAGANWWQALVDSGGEGAVVKPADGLVRGPRGLVQPGLKVRGPDYLRLVYGPHYREDANLTRLARRNVGRKRSLALREYALGLESLHRFVAGEPLWRVHEAAAAVLALESDPVDPRL
ncbi:polynucleotide kinase-phosphatase [Pseudonocardia spinosispora]|uniref:polynucleotide kinase-phosphatase n=1 Tax=Pseudonocardia spinosispora TaxID=103441 RepID=UPI000421A56A|nr:polynucleotide kinase-phosphatase [Pseudonocardia spinosispora]